MKIEIRAAVEKDYPEIQKVVEAAFKDEEMSDHTEHELIMKIKESDAYIPALSLVAVAHAKIVGHIMMSRIEIMDGQAHHHALALAPLSVLPAYQHQGIGRQLIRQAVDIAGRAGYSSIIVLGHHTYYPKFGFRKASDYGIYPPFDVPEEYFMVLPLDENRLANMKGTVKYSSAFE